MYTIFSVVALFFAVSAAAPITNTLPVSGRLSDAEKEDLRRRIKEAGGCNANVCFAIDGSRSISPTEFQNEKNFVLDVSSVIAVDQPAELAAAQFSSAVSPIHPLTADIAKFNEAMQSAAQIPGKSFVVGGINYCFSQLWRRKGEANKIVLLGDGRSNIGADAIARADLFRRSRQGSVSVVAAGDDDYETLLAIAGGKHDHVFQVTSFFDVFALQELIDTLALQVCAE